MMTRLTIFLILTAALASAQGPTYPYTVNLNFTASTGIVMGYNMYRAPFTTACGTYAKLNASPFTGTSYTDQNPPQGFYCYAATAVDGTQESGFSNIDSNISIPPPPPTGLGATLAGKNSNQVIWAWTQSAGKQITHNSLYCRAANGSYQLRWNSTAPATKAEVAMLPGTHSCAATASTAHATSGLSNVAQVVVP